MIRWKKALAYTMTAALLFGQAAPAAAKEAGRETERAPEGNGTETEEEGQLAGAVTVSGNITVSGNGIEAGEGQTALLALRATGDFTVAGGTLGTDYTYSNGVLTIISGTPMAVGGTTATGRIEVKSGVRADITFDNLTVTSPDNHPFGMSGAEVTLHLKGVNTLNAPVRRAALFCPRGSKLIIDGEGTLNANASTRGGGAAIGAESSQRGNFYESDDNTACGEITINGGTVNAICDAQNIILTEGDGYAIGIGGDGGGPITINGGEVKAIAGEFGVGIGGLYSAFGGININGGTVYAETKRGTPFNDVFSSTSFGPAIGVTGNLSPYEGTDSYITITGGNVTAKSNFGCAGIGGGRDGSGGIITIKGDAVVNATGGEFAPGIGGGYVQNGNRYGKVRGGGGIITIEGDADVTARGGVRAPGIGGSAPRQADSGTMQNADGWSGVITIAGNAKVKAAGGVYAPGIGSGAFNTDGASVHKGSRVEKIVITGNASVAASGGSNSICNIGPGLLTAHENNLSPEERFGEYICTVPGVDGGAIEAMNSLTIDENGNYAVKGEVTLSKDFTVGAGKTITIEEGAKLKVPAGVTFTCPSVSILGTGELIPDGGTIIDGETPPPAPVRYSLKVTGGLGSGSYKEGEACKITAQIPEGKVFVRWEVSGSGVIGDANAASTTFTMGAGDAEVTAVYKNAGDSDEPDDGDGGNNNPDDGNQGDSDNNQGDSDNDQGDSDNNQGDSDNGQGGADKDKGGSGGGQGSSGGTPTGPADVSTGGGIAGGPALDVQIPVQPDTAGGTTATLADSNIMDMLSSAANRNLAAKGISLSVKSDVTAGISSQTLILPKAVLDRLIEVNTAELSVKTELLAICFDWQALKRMQQAGGDIIIRVAKQKTLSSSAKKLIGNRPVFAISVSSTVNGVETAITDFGAGVISMGIPYTLGAEELAGGLFGVSVNKEAAALIKESCYNAADSSLWLNTNHLSVFGIGYQAAVSAGFEDIESHWAKEEITFVLNRGWMKGTGAKKFSPDEPITGEALLAALSKLGGVDVSGMKTPGEDKKQALSRQEMAVILAGYVEIMGYSIPQSHREVQYLDSKEIAGWAAADIKNMQMAGVIAGMDERNFAPKQAATRAQAAAALHRLLTGAVYGNSSEGFRRNDAGHWTYYKNGGYLTGEHKIGDRTYYFNYDGTLKQ